MLGEVTRVAAAVNLTDELDKRLAAYSGGMKQRLLLASALLGDPKLLILTNRRRVLTPKERGACARCWPVWHRTALFLWQRTLFRM